MVIDTFKSPFKTFFQDWDPVVLLSSVVLFVSLLLGGLMGLWSVSNILFLGGVAFGVAQTPMWVIIWVAYSSIPLLLLCDFLLGRWLNIVPLLEPTLLAGLLLLASFFVQSHVLTRRDIHGGILACLYTVILLPFVFAYHAGMSLFVPLLFLVQSFLAEKRLWLLLVGFVVLCAEIAVLFSAMTVRSLSFLGVEQWSSTGEYLWFLIAFCAFCFFVLSLFLDASSLSRKRCCLLGAGSTFLVFPLVVSLVLGHVSWFNVFVFSPMVWALTVGILVCMTKRERGGNSALRPVVLRSLS